MTVYKQYYDKGVRDKAEGKGCECPSTLPYVEAFMGYMIGYGGGEYCEPVSPKSIIDELHARGMTTIN